MNEVQKMIYSHAISELKKEYILEELDRIDDQNSSILPNIRNKIIDTSGMVIFAFKQYKVSKAEFRWWNEKESKIIENNFFTTPWIYIEAGIGIALKKPMLIISDFNIDDGVFIDNEDDDYVFLANPNGDFEDEIFRISYTQWSKKIQDSQ